MKFNFNVQTSQIYTLKEVGPAFPTKAAWKQLPSAEGRKYPFSKYAYSVGRVGQEPIAGHRPTKEMYGASIQKPWAAFLQLVKCKHNNGPCLNENELFYLIAYGPKGRHWKKANEINRDIAGRWPKSDSPSEERRARSEEIRLSRGDVAELNPIFGLKSKSVRWGDNFQSPADYNKFMSLLLKFEGDPNSDYHNEAKKVLKHMRARQGGYIGKRPKGDPRGANIKEFLNNELEKKGYGRPIHTMYGKGGKMKDKKGVRNLNAGYIINNNITISLYTEEDQPDASPVDMRFGMHDLLLDIFVKNFTPKDFDVPTIEMPPEHIHVDLPPEVMLKQKEEESRREAEIGELGQREVDRYAQLADEEPFMSRYGISAQEADYWVPDEIDKMLDLKAADKISTIPISSGTSSLQEYEEKQFGKPLSLEDLELAAEQGDEGATAELERLVKMREEEQKFLQESVTPLIKVDVALKYEKDFSFYGNVLNQIRSIKGVAIAKASDVGVVNIGSDKKMVLMHIKFMPDRPLQQYLIYLQMELKKIKDKNGDRIIATQIKGIPREVEV